MPSPFANGRSAASTTASQDETAITSFEVPPVAAAAAVPRDGSSAIITPQLQGKTFVRKLHTLLTVSNEYSSIISWNEEGTSVIVHDVDAFISTVMPVHYKESKFESWARRMRRWGFAGGTTKKIVTLPPSADETDAASNDGDGKPVPLEKQVTKMEFTNELFTRDRPELVALMMDERKAKKQVVVQRLYNSKVGGDEINSVAIGGRVMKRQISSLVEHSNNKANAAKKQRVNEMEEARLRSGVCVHKPTLSSWGGMMSSEEASSFDRERAAEVMALSAARAAGFNEMTAAMMDMKNNGGVGYYNRLQSPYHHHHRSAEEYSLLPPPPPKLHSYGMMMKMMLPPPPPPSSFHHYPPPHYPPPPHRYDGYGARPRYGDSLPPPQQYVAPPPPPPPPQPPIFFDLPPPRGYPPSHLSYHEHIMKMKEEHHRQMAMMRMHQSSHQPPYPSVPHGLPQQPTIEQTTKPVNLDVVFKRKAGAPM